MKKTLTFYRLILIGLIMLFGSGWAKGQTSLIPGDIAITGVNMDGDDEISIVFLVDIEIGTEIKFTDNGWKSDNTWRGGEGVQTWTASSSYIAGDEIVIQLTGLSLAADGDQVILYQNDADMIAAINDEGANIWQADATSSNTSALPQGLTNGVNCVALSETDNIMYDRSVTSGTKSEILTAINDYTNWTGHNTTRQTLSNSGFTITATTTNTWTGNGDTDTDWATSANWSNGVPTANHNVTIPTGLSNYPIISTTTSANCYDLTLVGTATANIISDDTKSGSLIFGGTYTGSATTVTYQRYLTGADPAKIWHLMGSPFTGQTIDATFLSNNSISGMVDFVESPEAWNTEDYTSTPPDVAFSLGQGYATRRSSDGIVSLTGTPNNATVNVSLTRGALGYGWNLLSNPFTSAISANSTADATNNLITINAGVLDDSFEAIYIWDQTVGASGDYVIINHASGTPSSTLAQNYLQVGQGFFVKSIAGGGSFSITPAMQSHQTGIAFKSDNNSWANIVLNVETTDANSSTRIAYREDMNRGLDIGYDAGTFKSGSINLYSRLVEDNSIDFGIQCLPSDYENLIVPIGLDAKAGEIITFKANALNIPEDYAVVLEDRALNVFTDLSNEGSYSIQLSEDSKGTGRFFVHTSFKSTTGIGDRETKNIFQVFTRPAENQLYIRGEVIGNTLARIYSITGKQMAVVSLQEVAENRIPFNGDAGIYILQISSKNETFTQKFAWVK